MRQVIGIVATGRFGDHEGTLDMCIISDPLEPGVCEICPPGTPPYAVYTRDEDGIALCMPHSFDEVVTVVEPRKLYQTDGTVIDPWAVT